MKKSFIKSTIACGALIVFSSIANAQAKQTYFKYTTTSGKVVEFSRVGAYVKYSYGKPGVAPDLAFSVPLSTARFEYQMASRGGSQSVSITFNGVTYEGIAGFLGGYGDYGRVVVTKSSRILADTECKRDEKFDIESNFKGTAADQ